MQHHTLKNPCKIQGIGIHSGKKVTLILNPTKESEGIYFIRTDLNNEKIKANPSTLKHTTRATALSNGVAEIKTPEHLMAALYALNISNIEIQIDSEEIPILDGSAAPFIEALLNSGVAPQNTENTPITLTEPLFIKEENAQLAILPSPIPLFTYILEYNEPVGKQIHHYSPLKDNFKEEVAPARTFGFMHEIDALKAQGLALGGSLENALVIDNTKYINEPRFKDECARHKCLDLIGDFWILNRPLNAHVIGICSGHKHSMMMVQKISSLIQK